MACRVLFSTLVLAAGLAAGTSADAAQPYAVTELGGGLMNASDVQLTESGHVQFTVFNGYPVKEVIEWSPSGGFQSPVPWVDPWAAQASQGITVLASNQVGGWAGKAGNPYESGSVLVGDASGATAPIGTWVAGSSLGSLAYMRPIDMNDHAMVVGSAELPTYYVDRMAQIDGDGEGEFSQLYFRGGQAPFVWTPEGGAQVIPSFLQTYGGGQSVRTVSIANAVNNLGQVVGSDGPAQEYNSPDVAFIWSEADGLRSLGNMLGYYSSEALDINDAGVVVGHYDNWASFQQPWDQIKGFVWTESEGMRELDALLTLQDKTRGVSIKSAFQVNEQGQILAKAMGGGGGLRYVLLTPVPEPATQGLMLLGLIGVGIAARRR